MSWEIPAAPGLTSYGASGGVPTFINFFNGLRNLSVKSDADYLTLFNTTDRNRCSVKGNLPLVNFVNTCIYTRNVVILHFAFWHTLVSMGMIVGGVGRRGKGSVQCWGSCWGNGGGRSGNKRDTRSLEDQHQWSSLTGGVAPRQNPGQLINGKPGQLLICSCQICQILH